MASLLSVLLVAVLVFALVDIITSDSWRIRYLPKVAWALLVVFLPLIGSILWFVLGKERATARPGAGAPPARAEAPRPSSAEDELAAIEREIEYHEKQAEIRRLEEQLRAKREKPTE